MHAIVNDVTGGFGWPVTVTNPDGASAELVGLSTDIALAVDPDTGQLVTGRQASVALTMQDLDAAGLGRPRAIADENVKPWVVQFDDIEGEAYTFRVDESAPDSAIGMVVCLLGNYVP
jgi:hypothetical protein